MNSRQKSINANVFIDYKVDVEHICHELESQGLEVLDFELDENHNLVIKTMQETEGTITEYDRFTPPDLELPYQVPELVAKFKSDEKGWEEQ